MAASPSAERSWIGRRVFDDKRHPGASVVGRLHSAQGSFYAGGPATALHRVLAEDVAWHVPGASPIAGIYPGQDAVLAYFARRRDLAGRTFRMHPREVLSGDGDHVAVITDGTATVGGSLASRGRRNTVVSVNGP